MSPLCQHHPATACKLIHKIIFARRVILILEELRNMVQHEIRVSGRLQIKTSDKLQQRVLTWRGVASVKAQFKVPTLILDAMFGQNQGSSRQKPYKVPIKDFVAVFGHSNTANLPRAPY